MNFEEQLEIELPPTISDSFVLPQLDESNEILISPTLVEKKIANYTKMQLSSPSLDKNVSIIIPSTKQDVRVSQQELIDIVLNQLVDSTSIDMPTDKIVEKGMKMCAHLYRYCSESSDDIENCGDNGFNQIMYGLLTQSWVPESAARSLSGYLSHFLNGTDNVSWDTIKQVFDFVLDENTLVLVYLVTFSYTLQVCSPKQSFFKDYPGYHINDLNKYITNGVMVTTEMTKTNKLWPGIILRDGDSSTINAMALSEWFIIAILALQTGYVAFRMGEKIWKLVQTIIDHCAEKKGKLTSKQLKKIFDQQSKKLLK